MSKLSPSKAHRFLNCTKSLEYDTAFVETPASIRGNILHEYAEKILKNQATDDFERENKIDDYEHFLVNAYADAVFEEMAFYQHNQLHTENKTSMQLFGNDINLIIDALLLSEANKMASIIDLKSGNYDIDPENNEQLLLYAFYVAQDHDFVENFRLSIFQKGKLKTWTITKKELYDYIISIYDTIDDINNNRLSYNPSDKACKFCEYKNKCIARAEWIVNGKK